MSLANALGYLSRSGTAHNLSALAIGSHLTIFCIHRLDLQGGGLSPAMLRKSLDALRNAGFQFVSLATVVESPQTLPPRAVCITVDDGFWDQAEILAPILLEYDTRFTFCVITDLLDGHDWPWDEKIAWLLKNTARKRLAGLERFGISHALPLSDGQREVAKRVLQNRGKALPSSELPPYLAAVARACHLELPGHPPPEHRGMDWTQARELETRGVRFAPHSCNHYITSRLGVDEAEHQFSASWRRLEEELQQPLKVYCYPTGRQGDFSPTHEQMLAQMGYRGAVSFISNPLRLRQLEGQRYRLPRIAYPASVPLTLRYASWIEALRSLSPTR